MFGRSSKHLLLVSFKIQWVSLQVKKVKTMLYLLYL